MHAGNAGGPAARAAAMAGGFLQVAWTLFLSGASQAADPSPRVQFDLSPVVACREVPPPESSPTEPGELLLEAAFDVSALIQDGREDDLLQFFYRLESPRGTLRVAGYTPQTTLASDQAGNVAIETKKENSRHAGVAVTGPLSWPVKLTGSGDLGDKNSDALRYEVVPQSIAVVASGTLGRGQGVYFKLKPSRSSTLEGARRFSVTFRVPADWRADWVHVTCTAEGLARGLLPGWDSRVNCGTRRFAVALYRQGDARAKAAAEQLVLAEAELWKILADQQEEIRRRSRPTFVHRVGVPLDLIPPAIPPDWPQQLVYGPAPAQLEDFACRLPADVQQAVRHYTLARRELLALGEAAGSSRLR